MKPTKTHTHTHENPYPQPWVWVFVGMGMGFYEIPRGYPWQSLYISMVMSRETKSHHIRQLCQMYTRVANATKPLSQDPDKTESMLYEPVNAILNFLQLWTDQCLSVSPVRRLIREYLADVDGCRSFDMLHVH